MRKRKKVLFIINATTHYYNLVLNKLNESTDYEIEVAVPKQRDNNVGAGVYQTEENLKIPIHHLDERKRKFVGCYFPDLPRLLWKVKPDLIVTLEYYQRGVFLNPAVAVLLKALGTKVILKTIPFQIPKYQSAIASAAKLLRERRLTLRRVYDERNRILQGWANKWFYSSAYDAMVCYVQKAYEILPTYGTDPNSIFITYNSPDTDMLLELNEQAKKQPPILSDNPHRLVHVGRLVEWKRVDLIISAMHALKAKYPRIELLVIGNGPMRDAWQKVAADLGMSEHVKFLGGIYDLLELGRYFRSSAIYVLGGMGGLSINDAMSFERAILCSECDGTEVELVRDGQNGYYFKTGDALDLAEKIDRILCDPMEAVRMGRRSHEIIQNEINIHRVLEGYVGAFDFALNGAKAARAARGQTLGAQ